MKKLLLILIALLLLSGCHGSKQRNAFSVPEEFDLSREYDVVFWAKNDTNKNQVNVYENAIRSFEELYPNIHVQVKYYTDYLRIYNDVITNISTDTTPNVCITYPDHIATYLTGDNVVVSLDDLLVDENYGLGGKRLKFNSPEKDELVDEFLDECKIADSYYAIPFMRSTEALYINKTYVEKLGYRIPEEISWDFVFEVSEKAMAKDDEGNYLVNGQKVMIPFIYKSTDNMMITMLKQLKAPYSSEKGEVLLFNDVTEDILKNLSAHSATGAFSTFKISSYPANFLNAGQCIFAIDSTAGSTWMGSKAPLSDIAEENIVEFETVVTAIPQYDSTNKQMISQGPSICIFNKEDKQEVLASWLFAQYLLTDEVQIGYAKTEGYVPVSQAAASSDAYQEYLSLGGSDDNEHYQVKIDATKLLLANIDHTFVTPVFNGSASLREAAGQLIENTCKSTRRKETIDDEYFRKLYSDLNLLYHLDDASLTLGGPKDLGPLPFEAKLLLGSLGVSWVLIISYVIYKRKKSC